MVLYNPYMKKRPRSDDTSNTTTSVVYRPSNGISHGTIMSNDIGNIRIAYQPSTRLVGSNVVSERNCAYEAMSTNCISNGNNTSLIRTNTTINNQNTLNHSTLVITKESSPISTLSRNCSINQTKQSNTSTSTDNAPHEMDSKSIFADIPVRKPSPNPYLKRRNQYNSLSLPHGPGVSRVTQRQKVDTTSSQVQSALPQQSLPPISVPTTMQPHSMASLRPESWKSITNPPATNVKSGEAQSFVSRNTSQQIVCSPSQQQQSQKSTPVETPMAGLPDELKYSPEDIKPVNDSYRLKLIQNAELAKPLLNGWTLYPHQKKAIVRSLTMRRMILALDMGLGKTLIGAVWSKAFKKTFDNLKIFVISPVSLKEEWKRTVQEKVGLQVEEERSTKKCNKKSASQDDHDDDVDDGLKLRICSWAKVPTKVDPNVEHFVVCCDEAHSMQSTQAQRTRDVLTLVSDKRCVGLLLLTGTPMKNGKPANLFPLLKAVRHPLGRHQKAFETHFCNGMLKNFGKGAIWDASGCSNLEQLKSLVSSNLLHMTKKQCLNDLPPMTNVMHDVPVSSRYQIQYEKAVKDLASVHANAKQLQDEAVLGAVQRVRITCAHAKIDAAVNLARTILNKEPALVIFSSFVEVAKQVHEKLSSSGWPSELLTGDTPQKKRQEMVDKFQSGLSSVFVCTFGAGGVGLTLTAACTIILLDRPWTPGETRQAEDRIRRIGQVKPCTSYWMRSFELDRQIDQVLASKDQTTKAVLNKSTEGSGGLSGPAAKISVAKLAQSFLLSKSRSQLPR